MRKENQILNENSHQSGWIQESQLNPSLLSPSDDFYSQNQHGIAQGAFCWAKKSNCKLAIKPRLAIFPLPPKRKMIPITGRRKEIYGNSK
jgi:hypothetical protein